ncbi:clathrin interactor EPSIN 2-like isoform X3 [Canna indica]|uniref:Clathrin interactor EPSIN 2-like isoform X3 n=1 Tax=Canna indica TaxID=4628 RepID=A0AAQ3L6X6_9LILI|nr:clathrin interactor EPSIN 2-like isoform X3 [Canna indica]
MKKALGQTVRELKREVNKKVLKVPGIEQKVLDATSNEPWGPHGTLLAEISQATKNYHEYQMITSVLWKRINDTGKNWRHVYKALIVLEYLVAHGSERVIDDIREHAHQISSLSGFQYIDSSGRDQGSNVRRKSQSLVALVNDKERILEVRQTGTANRDKYRGTASTDRPGGYGDYCDYDRNESRNANRDEDRYGNEKEREMGYRDDRSSRGRDSYGREEHQNGAYSGEHYGKDGYRHDDFRGGHGHDDDQYGSRNRGPNRNHSFDDDHYSSRSGGGRADDLPRDDRQLDHRLSEQSIDAPPSYEEATRDSQNNAQEDKNKDHYAEAAPKSHSPSAPKASSPSESTNQGSSSPFAPMDSSPSQSTNQVLGHAPAVVSSPINNNDNDSFDEFDPRGSISAGPPAASSLEMDLFGLVSGSDPIYSLTSTPLPAITNGTEADHPSNSGLDTDFMAMPSASDAFSQHGENPFGDPTFVATQEDYYNQGESFARVTSFNSSSFSGGAEVSPPAALNTETSTGFDFDLSFGVVPYNPILAGQQSSFSNSATLTNDSPTTQPKLPNNDISGMLAPQTGPTAFGPKQEAQPAAPTHIQGNQLPQSGPPTPSHIQGNFPTQSGPAATSHVQGNFLMQANPPAPSHIQGNFPTQSGPAATSHLQGKFLTQANPPAPPHIQGNFPTQPGPPATSHVQGNFLMQANPPARSHIQGNFLPQSGPTAPSHIQGNFLTQANPPAPSHIQGNFLPQSGPTAPSHIQESFLPQAGPPASMHIQGNLLSQSGPTAPSHIRESFIPQAGPPGSMHIQGKFLPQSGQPAQLASQENLSSFLDVRPITPANNQTTQLNLLSQPGSHVPSTMEVATPAPGLQPSKTASSKEKFETKSTVWADTLSRGLVNLNISGPKTNPHADIGIDFESMNRKDKREEKKVSTTPVSTITMGKAMGTGSGIGRAGANAMAGPPNPMMGSGMGMGMGMMRGPGMMGGPGMGMMGGGGGMGMGMGMGGYGGNMSQPMSMGMNQGMPSRPPMGVPPGSGGMPGVGYNPMMGMGNYGSQQPFGGGYR